MSCDTAMRNLEAFFSHYSKTKQELGSELQLLFDAAFHPDIRFVVNGKDHEYDFMLNQVTQIFREGSQIENLVMEKLGEDHFHYSMMFTQGDNGPTHHLHSQATIRDGKVWRVEPITVDESYMIIFENNTSNQVLRAQQKF